MDRGVKAEDYAAHGVAEYWLVDPQQEQIEKYLLKGRRYGPATVLRKGSISSRSLALPRDLVGRDRWARRTRQVAGPERPARRSGPTWRFMGDRLESRRRPGDRPPYLSCEVVSIKWMGDSWGTDWKVGGTVDSWGPLGRFTGGDFREGRRSPQQGGAVVAHREEGMAIVREADFRIEAGLAGEHGDVASALDIPDLDRVAARGAGGDQAATVRRERQIDNLGQVGSGN
ncbi:MAG: Uma2 family endonuclease [Verrucomicrobia bacterium]|nr:Uma2 family endonuclease [Verrucomicrobiota bacterium]